MEMQGQVGEINFTLQVTRKDTGLIEEVEMVGYLNPEQLEQLQREAAESKD